MTEDQKQKQQPFLDSGILLVDKPKDWTSHDVVNFIRRRFKAKKVGHCGTLDPAATGLLIIVIGKATKISQKLSGEDKIYEATILLGTETDSMDMEGKVITQNDDWEKLSDAKVINTINSFKGSQMQIPPMVSAKKVNGKKLYELARKGKTIERKPVPITINSIRIQRIQLPEADFTVSCSKGTYIRVLCSDIGEQLGCGAVLKNLRRTKSGTFSIENSFPVDKLKTWENEDLANNLLWLHNINLNDFQSS